MISFKSCVQQEKEKLNCKCLNETLKIFVIQIKILPQLLTKLNHEEKNSPTYRSQKGVFVHSHQESLENTSDPNTISRKSSGTNIPHWESWSSVFTQKHLSILKKHYLMLSSHSSPQSSHESQAGHFTVIHWCACQDSQQDHVFFSWKTKSKKPNLYQSFWSDWQNRTLDKKSVSEILKKGPLFSNRVRQTKKKCIH